MLKAVFIRRLLTTLLALSLVVGTGPHIVAFAAGGAPEIAAGRAPDHDHHVLSCPDCPNVCLCGITCGAAIATASAAVAAPSPDRGFHSAVPQTQGASADYRRLARGPPPVHFHPA